MPQSSNFLALDGQQRVAQGQQKWVFEHPSLPGCLIKVANPEYVSRWRRQWFRFARYGHYLPLLREIGEYVVMHASCEPKHHYLETVRGLVATNYGLGLVVEAVLDEQGQLAPNLVTRIQLGLFAEQDAQAIERFLQWLGGSRVIVYDLNLGNLIIGAQGRVVMIDGIGEPDRLRWRLFLPGYNRFKNRRKIKRFRFRLARQLTNPDFR